MMVMPYPPDERWCRRLRTAQELLCFLEQRVQTMERLTYEDKEILKPVLIFIKIGLEHPCNIQFRYLNGIPYFLEVNTRMSEEFNVVSGMKLISQTLR